MEGLSKAGTSLPQDPTTSLCDRCQALQFDDEELGGFVGTSSSGDPVLAFDHVHRPRRFHIPWECDDHLPDLVGLKASAESGCEFCAFLRDSIIRTSIKQPKGERSIHINLYYLWGNNRYGSASSSRQDGLLALVAYVQVGSDSSNDENFMEFLFSIGSDDGMCYDPTWILTLKRC